MAQISPYPAPVRRHSSVRLGGDEIRLRAQLLHLEEQALCEEAVGFPVAAKDRVHQEEGPVCEEAIQEHPDLSDLSFIRQEAGGDAVKMDAHLLPLAADEGHFIGVAVKVVVGVARLRAQDGGGQGAGLHAMAAVTEMAAVREQRPKPERSLITAIFFVISSDPLQIQMLFLYYSMKMAALQSRIKRPE